MNKKQLTYLLVSKTHIDLKI